MGRNPYVCNTIAQDMDVSKSHATIFWDRGGWHLRDHSRNGTLLNGRHLHRATAPMKEGDTLQLGKDSSTCWELHDASPPTSFFKSLHLPSRVMTLAERRGLPCLDHPQISWFYSSQQTLALDLQGAITPLEQGKRISLMLEEDEEEWVFMENQILDDTLDYGLLAKEACFELQLSADEEHVSLAVQTGDHTIDLGERSHHYLVLALMRKRLEDQAQGYPPSEQGWMGLEDLGHDMSLEFRREVDEYQINNQIHRFRKQLFKSEPIGYLFSGVIERRKGEVRFSHPGFRILKEGECLGEMQLKTAG